MNVSIVQYFGEQSSKCGYCTGKSSNKSHGMHAFILSCNDYQDLIDRGWRRCGNYCYKPQNAVTCCPCYTIKCDALEFKLTKSHKRILRRMNKFLRDGKRELSEPADNGDDVVSGDIANASEAQPQLPDMKPSEIDVDKIEALATKHAKEAKSQKLSLNAKPTAESVLSLESNKSVGSSSNPVCKKAKQMRLERRQAKMGGAPQQPQTKPIVQEKSLRDFLNSSSTTDKHKLKIVLVPASDTQRTCTDEVHALYCKYQIVIHSDNSARLTPARMQRFLVISPLKLCLVDVHGEEFKRTLKQSYQLYGKYQTIIHNDPPRNQKAYQDHLQQSPMKHQTTEHGPDCGYGSFHQQYWLDDKLIAVGVIDILPSSVSSVYFFYDPDYSFLSLGTYGSLREIELVQTLAECVPALKYYYMGFYIHTCPKMRYKGKLCPSYLLCPETYIWLSLTDAIRVKLDAQQYQRLNPDDTAKDVDEFMMQHLNDVKLLVNAETFITYKQLQQSRGSFENRDQLIEYCKLVGTACAHKMLYVHMS